MILDDNLPIPNVVTNPNYQLIIFDFDLAKCKNMEELKTEIKRANTMLGNVYDACRKYDYTLVFSSLYGIEREWKRDNTQVYNINYMAEVPFVVCDRLIIRGKHFLKAGSNAFILPTVCALMDPTKNYTSLVSMKQSGGILSQFGIK